MRIKHYVLILTMLAGLPFIIMGGYGLYENLILVQHSKKTQGVVVNNTSRLYADGTTALVPVIKFKISSGEIIRYTDNIGSMPADYNEGDSVSIYYDAAKPQRARINTFKRIWFESVLFFTIGFIPVVIGLIVARKLAD